MAELQIASNITDKSAASLLPNIVKDAKSLKLACNECARLVQEGDKGRQVTTTSASALIHAGAIIRVTRQTTWSSKSRRSRSSDATRKILEIAGKIEESDVWKDLIKIPILAAVVRINEFLNMVRQFTYALVLFLDETRPTTKSDRIQQFFTPSVLERATKEIKDKLRGLLGSLNQVSEKCSKLNTIAGKSLSGSVQDRSLQTEWQPTPIRRVDSHGSGRQFPVDSFVIENLQPLPSEAKRKIEAGVRKTLDLFRIPDYSERHHMYRSQWLKETCDWIIDVPEYSQWKNASPVKGPTLWCVGNPGIGKSVLSSWLIDHLKKDHDHVAYFYLAYGKVQSASDMAASLLYQLIASTGILPECLQTFYVDRKPRTPPLPVLHDALRQLSERTTKVFIVIDAFDEHNMIQKEAFEQTLELLRHLLWSVFLTTRSHEQAYISRNDGALRFWMGPDRTARDIDRLLTTGLEDFLLNHSQLQLHEEFKSEIVSRVGQASKGMFYWAAVQLDMVLQQTTVSGISETLNVIESRKPELTALQSIDRQPLEQQTLARIALAWVADLKWPLSLPALCEALALRSVDFETKFQDPKNRDLIPIRDVLLGACRGLVIKDFVTSTVVLSQYSLQQHILNKWSDVAKDPIPDLTEFCLRYLLMKDFENIGCQTETELKAVLQQYHFLEYASHCWHLFGQRDKIEKVRPLAVQLLGKKSNLTLALQVYLYTQSPPNPGEAKWSEVAEKALSMSALLVAARFGLVALVPRLLVDGHDPSVRDCSGWTPLHEAVRQTDFSMAQALVDGHARLDLADNSGKLPIHYAMLSAQARLDKPSKAKQMDDIFRFLMRSSAHSQIEASFKLAKARPFETKIQDGRAPDSRSPDGLALLPAILEGVDDRELLLRHFILLEFGASFGDDRDISLEKEYLKAVRDNNRANILILLESNVNPNTLDSGGVPALHLAIENGFEDIVQIIMCRNGNVSICKAEFPRESALQCAVRLGKTQLARLLLSKSLDLEYHDGNKVSALSLAVRQKNVDMVRLLLRFKAELKSENPERPTVLFDAVDTHDLETAESLLDQYVDLEAKNGQGCTVLFEAVKANNKQLIGLLLQNGADVLTENKDGERLLHAAAQVGDIGTIKEIVHCLLDIVDSTNVLELTNQKGQTPAQSLADPEKREAYVAYMKTWEYFGGD